MQGDETGAPVRILQASHTQALQPYGVLLASIAVDPNADLLTLADRLTALLGPHFLSGSEVSGPGTEALHENPPFALFDAFIRCIGGLQEAAGIPVLKVQLAARELAAAPGETVRVKVALPAFRPPTAARAMDWVVALANDLSASPHSDALSPEQRRGLDALMEELRQVAPAGNNMRHLIRAAWALGIPCLPLPMGVYQLGWGRHARLFRSSETDATPVIGASLSQNKLATAALLRAAELPVPQHEAAPSPAAAVAIARKLGFPVVVKPVDMNKGAGATAGLTNENDVRRAYQAARSASENVMVEKHVDGKEYRLVVVRGRLFWAYERAPARVIGDGISPVGRLIDAVNASRRPGPGLGLSLRTIELGDAARKLLRQQGLTPDSIPAAGRMVRLERVPSVAGGGEVIPVMDGIHPDNVAIAERAARLLRLDIAGLDFLTPDIARSWREVGGKITEVNEQPQISPLSRPDIYHALLGRLMRGDGRIPVAIVFGSDAGAMEAETRERLAAAGIRAGVASGRAIHIGESEIAPGGLHPFRAARALVIDPTVEVLIMFTDGQDMLRDGIPFDRIDLLVVGEGTPNVRRLLSLARRHLKDATLMTANDAAAEAGADFLDKKSVRLVKSQDLAPSLCERIVAMVKG